MTPTTAATPSTPITRSVIKFIYQKKGYSEVTVAVDFFRSL